MCLSFTFTILFPFQIANISPKDTEVKYQLHPVINKLYKVKSLHLDETVIEYFVSNKLVSGTFSIKRVEIPTLKTN